MYRLRRIISGGQTGADQAGLFAAKELGIVTGGTVPKGWITETGPAPWLAEYGCVESYSEDYRVRTERNVIDSSGTIIFGDSTSPGSRLTLGLCRKHRKVSTVVAYRRSLFSPKEMEERGITDINIFLELYDITTLNVAGNRESRNPGIGEFTKKLLIEALRRQR